MFDNYEGYFTENLSGEGDNDRFEGPATVILPERNLEEGKNTYGVGYDGVIKKWYTIKGRRKFLCLTKKCEMYLVSSF